MVSRDSRFIPRNMMYTPQDSHAYILAFDVDRTIAVANHPIAEPYALFLHDMQQLPGVEVILTTGKSPTWARSRMEQFNGRYVIACNGAACKLPDGATVVYGANQEDLVRLRELLGLGPHDEGVQRVNVGDATYELAIEEDKLGVALAIFCLPEKVKHRWVFAGGISREAMYEHCKKLIADNNLQLAALEPHIGGNSIDIVRLHHGKPIDKGTLPEMIEQLFPNVSHSIAMFGDNLNDLPALTAPGVIGVTFAECSPERIIAPVKAHGGIVTDRPAFSTDAEGVQTPGGGPIEGILHLAKRNFFGTLSPTVHDSASKALTNFISDPADDRPSAE